MASRPTKSRIPNTRQLFAQVKRAANDAVIEAVGEFAEEQTDDFRRRIERQVFPDFRRIYYPESGTNLSPKWLARKQKKGADSRTLIATGHYKNSIRVWRRLRPRRRGADFRIGFHPRIQARNLDNERVPILLKDVAMIHEYGSVSGKIPRRSHWRPHLTLMRQRAVGERPKIRRAVLRKIRSVVGDRMKVKVL